MKRRALGLSVLLSLAASVPAFRASSFSVDMVVTKDGESQTTSSNFAEGGYTYETHAQDRRVVVIVDKAGGVTRVVSPAEMLYLEKKSSDLHMAMNDPFAACLFPYPGSSMRDEGAETVDGLPCTKKVLSAQGGDFFVSWISDEFGFPIKIEDNLNRRTIELHYILGRGKRLVASATLKVVAP